MKRQISTIIAVCILEAVFRVSYKGLGLDPVVYTLIVRIIQALIILLICHENCGIKTASFKKDVLIGIGISIGFGLLVLFGDLVSRLLIPQGVLLFLLKKQIVHNVFLFAFTACIFAPFVEELFFRGLVQSLARRYIPAVGAIIVSTLFFATMHGNISAVQLTGGLLFGIIFEWRGNIWSAYVFHVAANFGIWLYPHIMPWIFTLI